MNARILDDVGRVFLDVNDEITLDLVNCENSSRTFKIVEVLGCGGTAIAYKVSYEGSDNNRYLYVLKELYPVPTKGNNAISRFGSSLDIDGYEEIAQPSQRYTKFREQFESAYHIQNDMANGNNAVANMTTSSPVGLYEDRASSKKGNYAVYGLFKYYVGETLKKYKESSLTELINILRKIAEVVHSYHEYGYLWLDIKEANVNVIGAGTVQSVSMFDFGSLISSEKLISYKAEKETDFTLSFSPTSADLLLPEELEMLLPKRSTSDFAFVDVKKNEIYINALGESGVQTDIFLLGSMLYKRLMGKAPTVRDCEQLTDGCFDMARFRTLADYSPEIVAKVKRLLVNSLNYHDCDARYPSVSEYLNDINELYSALITKDGIVSLASDTRKYVTYCCEQYKNNILTGNADGKFRHLKELQGRFESRVTLRSDDNGKNVLPSVAINSAPQVGETKENNRLVFLYGDGGMGKSTTLYDYMCQAASVTPIYIELSQYRFIDRDTSFVFKKIFEDICKKFIDVAGFINHEELSRVEDILMESLMSLDPNDPRPQYVLLLDGYNEISKNDRGAFDNEIANIIDTWKNCRIVITGRNLPTDFEGKEIPTYEHFSRFEFIGISEEERKSLIEAKYPKRIEKIQQDERLWDVLRIPMFMGMFIQFDNNLFDSDRDVSIHTRGEILDHFIMKTEADAAEQIAKRQNENSEDALLRTFLVQFVLPFVASNFDNKRIMSNKFDAMFELITNGNLLYLTKKYGDLGLSVFNKAICVFKPSAILLQSTIEKYNASKKSIKEEREEEGEKPLPVGILKIRAMQDVITKQHVYHILITEAGYCYDSGNGEVAFTHQYFQDYFAAKHIQNILNVTKALGENGLSKDEQLQFTKDNGLDYIWSDDVCILLGEIIGDYKNEPGYKEE